MTEPALTLERLRNWLNTNQPKRERLCLHLLPLLGEYTDVRPRRPEGGPDGGRDLQAIYQGKLQVYGAVGFQNSVNDSVAEKTAMKKKFVEDLTAALNANSTLKGFLFFTNVDATPAEVRDLESIATEKGITHVVVFYRERLRIALDSPAGFGFRLQYLDIAMSPEEQVSFLTQLESLRERDRRELAQRHEEVERKLQRIEFCNELPRQIQTMLLLVALKRLLTPEELGHFRVLIQIYKMSEEGYLRPALYVGGRDSFMMSSSEGKTTSLYGGKTLVWSKHPDTPFAGCIIGSDYTAVRTLRFEGGIYRKGQFANVGDFDRTWFNIFVTRPLLEQIDAIGLLVNNYMIVELSMNRLVTAEKIGLTVREDPEWPEELTEDEKKVEWKQLFVRNADTDDITHPPPRRQATRDIHFNDYTPRRIDLSNPLDQTSWIYQP